MATEDTKSGPNLALYGASTVEDDDPFTLIATTKIASLTHVRLYQSTLVEHIFPGHPEVEMIGEEGIVEALENPSFILESTTRPKDSVVFVSEKTTYEGRPLHVPVRIIVGTSGRVPTSYFGDTSAGALKIWPRK